MRWRRERRRAARLEKRDAHGRALGSRLLREQGGGSSAYRATTHDQNIEYIIRGD
jgi:hypothetical protein